MATKKRCAKHTWGECRWNTLRCTQCPAKITVKRWNQLARARETARMVRAIRAKVPQNCYCLLFPSGKPRPQASPRVNCNLCGGTGHMDVAGPPAGTNL